MRQTDTNKLKLSAGMLMRVFLCLMLLGVAQQTQAAYFDITAKVRDKVTGFNITDGKYRVLSLPDSTEVRSGATSRRWINGTANSYNETIEPILKSGGFEEGKEYILEITHDNYEPYSVKFDGSKLGKRSDELDLGVIELVKAKVLSDVTVTATKVKFYNKGDTLIYNADAFQLAEGSMLDALIEQLPGVELKPGGEIFVNGRKVESLLLNSKDFFKGNNNILLENLGAYTVKNIAVYDGHENEQDKIMGKDYGKKILTMDVRLKKEYQAGFLMNMEAGYGIKDKFVGRLFGLYYNNVARVGFFGNANNISNTWNPMREGTSEMPSATANKITTYSAGVDYNVDPVNTKFNFKGNADFRYTITDGNSSTYITNLLPNGTPSSYGYQFNRNKIKQMYVFTEHCVQQSADKWNWQITPKFRYTKNTIDSHLISATFGREWDNIDQSFLESLYSNNNNSVLSSILNRNIQDKDQNSNTQWYNIWSNGKRKLGSSDAIGYLAAYTYERSKSVLDELYVLNLEDNAVPVINDRRHYDNTPNFNWRAKGLLEYSTSLFRGFHLDVNYTYQRYFSKAVSDLYVAQDYATNIAGNDLSHFAPSALSSGYGTLDVDNSYDSRYTEETHDVKFKINWSISNVAIWAELPLSIRRQWLHYMRGPVDAHLSRNKVFFGDANGSINWWFGKSKPVSVYIGYTRKVISPDMVNMVDFTNSLDALNIRMGNPNLKDSRSDNLRIYVNQTLNQKLSMRHGYGFEGTIYANSLAYGYTYDPQTAVRIGRMYNIMGNSEFGGYQTFSTAIPKFEKLYFNQITRFEYVRSADLFSTDNAPLTKNIVNNYGLTEKISLKFTESKFYIQANADITWNRYISHQLDFVPFNALNMRYAISGNVDLPANFSINTNFNVYMRRGYNEPSLNTTNYVWNARITYKALKGQLLFMLDGFDMLHNLSNVTSTVNAQARVETYNSVVPRYFMFHVQWKFNKLPKGKKKDDYKPVVF